jgi:hypothetical protein
VQANRATPLEFEAEEEGRRGRMPRDHASSRQSVRHLLCSVLLSSNATFEGVLIPMWDGFLLISLGILVLMGRSVIQLAHVEAT